MVTKSLPHHSNRNQRGATTIQVLILLVPVIMGLIGFAFDLGRLYSARNDLKNAANAMAMAMAGQLIGTDSATGNAPLIGALTANKYDFNGLAVGSETNGYTSTVGDPQFYSTLADAIGSSNEGSGNTVGGSAAKYVRVNVNGETPLVFWNFLSLVQNRRTTVQATAVAGVSAPLCTACSIEPITAQAVDSTDATDFGFVPGSIYTFAYTCTGNGTPGVLPGGGPIISYVLLNRLSTSTSIFAVETSQLLRMGADGLPPSTVQTDACFFLNTAEQIWATATPVQCLNPTANPTVQAFVCGLGLRFESTLQDVCATIPESDSISSIYSQDADLSAVTDYTQYVGQGRRVITIPIVDSIANTAAMTVLGFRQFLVEPNNGAVSVAAADAAGRFIVMYLGTVKPVRQGSFGGCTQSAGPGKVVLHR